MEEKGEMEEVSLFTKHLLGPLDFCCFCSHDIRIFFTFHSKNISRASRKVFIFILKIKIFMFLLYFDVNQNYIMLVQYFKNFGY